MLQPVAVQVFRVLVNTEGVAQAGAMFLGGGDDGSNPLDPLQPLPPVPPPPPDEAEGGNEATGMTQYHAECTSVDVLSCVPPCNAEHHGYEMLFDTELRDPPAPPPWHECARKYTSVTW